MPANTDLRKFYHNPLPTTDIIIEYNDGRKDGIVLIKRKNYPFGLAIPGGFAEYGLSFEENAIKEAKEETGLDIVLYNSERPLCVHSDPKRDPRGHITSATYVARGYGTLKSGDDAAETYLFSLEEIRDFLGKNKIVFDHGRALEKYLLKLDSISLKIPQRFQNENEKVRSLQKLWSD